MMEQEHIGSVAMGDSGEMIEIDGREYRKFIPYPEEITDGTLRCISCGQIDEEEYHDPAFCPACPMVVVSTTDVDHNGEHIEALIPASEAALSRPVQEPVAWEFETWNPMNRPVWGKQVSYHCPKPEDGARNLRPLAYAAPQPAHGTSATERVTSVFCALLTTGACDLPERLLKAEKERDALIAAGLKCCSGTPNPNLRPFDLAMSFIDSTNTARKAADMLWQEYKAELDAIKSSPAPNAVTAGQGVAVKPLEWTMRQGNFDSQLCWDADGYWIMRDDTGYSLCDLELSEIPGCSPFLGKFDRLEDAMADAQERALATPAPKEESK